MYTHVHRQLSYNKNDPTSVTTIVTPMAPTEGEDNLKPAAPLELPVTEATSGGH